jgi:hypothetical protein
VPDRFRWRLADLLILIGLVIIYAVMFELDYEDGLMDPTTTPAPHYLAGRSHAVEGGTE